MFRIRETLETVIITAVQLGILVVQKWHTSPLTIIIVLSSLQQLQLYSFTWQMADGGAWKNKKQTF